VWVALEPSTVENGCLRVIPRSHAERACTSTCTRTHDLTLNQRMRRQSTSRAVDIELEPGEMSLHDVYMIHGARANTRQAPHRAALRYMPSTSVFERDLRPVDGKSGVPVNFARRPLWLVKGVDRSGRNDFNIGHNQ
jgi:ectoine hydroxylase-related dioxygenase (phytanoyl-CoA dioxygenase family)